MPSNKTILFYLGITIGQFWNIFLALWGGGILKAKKIHCQKKKELLDIQIKGAELSLAH